MMRTLWPNGDREDALDTVLEVPIPEELLASSKQKSRQIVASWTTRADCNKINPNNKGGGYVVFGSRDAELEFLLGVIGAPLVPLPICCERRANDAIRAHSVESSMARYILQQYVAASGGEHALNGIDGIYAMGKVKMTASDFVSGEETAPATGNSKAAARQRLKNMRHGTGEMGGFVLWQKRPDLWSFDLMVSGCKISAGSDGKTAWRQTPWQHSYASRGPPRPTRRSLQGLDPRSTANLFSNSTCIGEKTVNNEDCFVLKLEVDPQTLRARSSTNMEIIRHTIWGCFSQRTGLLVQLEDTQLLKIKHVLWETTMESSIGDYRTIEGVNVAHGGRTRASLFRFGEDSESHRRTRMEEIWSIEEVDFNVKGLVKNFFLPPSDLKRGDGEGCDVVESERRRNGGGLGIKAPILGNSCRKNNTRVVAVDEENMEMFERDDDCDSCRRGL